MEPLRPLAYESLKTVLQYMEPNLRFKLANCIPSITSTEKLVPLKIKHLIFSPYEFVVNETSYKLGTYRHYPSGAEALRGHQDENSNGGVPTDLDQYGFADYSQEAIVTPGNIVIKDIEIFIRQRAPFPEEHAGLLESKLEVFEWLKAEELDHEVEPLNRNHPDYFLFEKHKNCGIEGLQIKIDRLKKVLAPVYCRRNNTGPLYSTMVQFTVSNPNVKKEVSRKAGDTKLCEPQNQLSTRLFGNRSADIYVKHLEVTFGEQMVAQMVVRLPPDLQIKVQRISVHRNAVAVCDALQSLIRSSSYPLEQFKTYHSNAYSTGHPTIRNAKKLIFYNYSFYKEIDEFLSYQNKKIYMGPNWFTSDGHVTLLNNWIANRREVGTSFISQIGEETTITEIFARCKEELNGYDAVGVRSIKIPMNETSEIEASYKFLKKRGKRTAQWMLIIKVVAV